MFAYWQDFVDAAALSVAAQNVIAMRLIRIAAGGPVAQAECRRMVYEKFEAAVAAQAAAAGALARGKSMETATRVALAPIRARVRANQRRLMRG